MGDPLGNIFCLESTIYRSTDPGDSRHPGHADSARDFHRRGSNNTPDANQGVGERRRPTSPALGNTRYDGDSTIWRLASGQHVFAANGISGADGRRFD